MLLGNSPPNPLQSGDAKDAVRKEVRALFDKICCFYAPPKLFGYVADGLKSKNSQQRFGENKSTHCHMHHSDYNGCTILRTFQTCCSSLPQSRPMGDVATLTNTFPYPRLQKSPALNSCDVHTLQNVP